MTNALEALLRHPGGAGPGTSTPGQASPEPPGGDAPRPPAKTERTERRLLAALKAMNLRLLLVSVCRCALPEWPQAKQNIESALQQLQETIAARAGPGTVS